MPELPVQGHGLSIGLLAFLKEILDSLTGYWVGSLDPIVNTLIPQCKPWHCSIVVKMRIFSRKALAIHPKSLIYCPIT